MQQSSTEPQLKQTTEIVCLHKTTIPLRRWSIDPRFNSTTVVVTVKNISDSDIAASLKFQHSTSNPWLDHQCTIKIPPTTPDPADGDNVNEVVAFTETFGGFNSTFSDISNSTITSLPAGGEKVLTFSTTKQFMQVVATTANNAKVMLFIKSANTLTATEGDYPRTDTAP